MAGILKKLTIIVEKDLLKMAVFVVVFKAYENTFIFLLFPKY